MIARRWTAPVPLEKRDAYIRYIMETGFADYRDTAGNMGAFLLLQEEDDRVYFTALTYWDSYESIRKFAGTDYGHARYYPADDDFLLEKPKFVTHEEVVHAMCDGMTIDGMNASEAGKTVKE